MKINVTPEMVANMTVERLEKKIKHYLEKGQVETARAFVNAYRRVEGFNANEMEFLILKVEKGEYSIKSREKTIKPVKRSKSNKKN